MDQVNAERAAAGRSVAGTVRSTFRRDGAVASKAVRYSA
jgi:hypothetical protein